MSLAAVDFLDCAALLGNFADLLALDNSAGHRDTGCLVLVLCPLRRVLRHDHGHGRGSLAVGIHMILVVDREVGTVGIGLGLGKLALACVKRRQLVLGRWVVVVVDRQEGVLYVSVVQRRQVLPFAC